MGEHLSLVLDVFRIGYLLGIVMVVMGVLILAGYFQIRGADEEGGAMLRTMFGLVLLLYGIYRVAITRMEQRRREREG